MSSEATERLLISRAHRIYDNVRRKVPFPEAEREEANKKRRAYVFKPNNIYYEALKDRIAEHEKEVYKAHD